MKKKKWVLGLLFNYVSLIFIALSNLAVNFIIASWYTSADVGRFNFLMSLWLVLAQIAACGLHQAAMCFSAQNPKNRSSIFVTSFITVLGSSSVVCIILLLIASLLLNGSVYKPGVIILSVTIIFTSINKVIMGYINGLGEMKIYAFLNTVRSILIVLISISVTLLKTKGSMLFSIYLISEAIVSFIGISAVLKILKADERGTYEKCWLKKELVYGVQILPSMLSAELKPKGSIFIMKIFFQDSKIGIYSFALLFIEGFYQIYVILRQNLNPQLAICMKEHRRDECVALQKDLKKILQRFSIPLIAAAYIGYHVLILLTGNKEYLEAEGFFLISAAAIAVCGYWILFLNSISFAGYPKWESFICSISLLGDLGIYYIAIYLYQEKGLIAASIISYLFYGILIAVFLSKMESRERS